MKATANIDSIFNWVCLLVACMLIWILPLHKEVWYDETISMMCAKGIPNDPKWNEEKSLISNADFEQINNTKNVYRATIVDNSNSYLYNILLHFTTNFVGNSYQGYMLLSRLSGLLSYLLFFMLARQLLAGHWLVGVAMLLLATDADFMGMTHEIRAYALGGTLAIMALIYLLRFLEDSYKSKYILLFTLCCGALLLTHFLSVYVIIAMVAVLLVYAAKQVITPKNIAIILAALVPVALYFMGAIAGLSTMSNQNKKIAALKSAEGFDPIHVLKGTLRFVGINSKIVFPGFADNWIVIAFSFLIVLVFYWFSFNIARTKVEKRNLHLLFWTGVSSSVFLAALCFKSGHYTALYYRYHTFGIPFATLFTVYSIWLIAKYSSRSWLAISLAGGITVATVVLFFIGINPKVVVKYNHFAVAEQLMKADVHEVTLPSWRDAWLIQCRLTNKYPMKYFKNPQSSYFAFQIGTTPQKVAVIAKDN